MSDVLFAFNQYALKPEAREKLAKVSGILLAYPDLKVQVEGYTDNVGTDQYNLTLSQQRAMRCATISSRRASSAGNVTSTGYGMSNPIADNSTAGGKSTESPGESGGLRQRDWRSAKPALSPGCTPTGSGSRAGREQSAPVGKV